MQILADLLCPERCAACATLVDPRALFCTACAARIRRLGPPECRRCGEPRASSNACPGCRDDASPIRAARAWAAYRADDATGPVARAVATFKYDGATRLGRRLAREIVGRVPDPSVALVVPVPLHRRRLLRRGYNQSAVLARHLARGLGCDVALTAVVRTRDTPSQVGLDVRRRRDNVHRAFAVVRPAELRDRTVLIVDDVWTSGATARAVAGAVAEAGARAVDVLTIARVL
jgi:ComF family protein